MARNRGKTFNKLFSLIDGEMLIVETGTIRSDEPRYVRGDGHSARKFAEYLRFNGGVLYSIDIDPEAVKLAKSILNIQYADVEIHVIHSDSVEWLLNFEQEIDILYLDSANDSKLILNEAKAGCPKLKEGGYILIDDIDESLGEKGKLVIPYLEKQGYELIEKGYQILFRKPFNTR